MVDHANAWKYCFKRIQDVLVQWRNELKTKNWKRYAEDWERYWHLDNRVDPVQFFGMCMLWESPEGKVISYLSCNIFCAPQMYFTYFINLQVIAEIASKNTKVDRIYYHHTGSKPYSQHAHELELAVRSIN